MYKKVKILTNMGFRWSGFRLKYELEKKLGLIEKKFKPIEPSNKDLIANIELDITNILDNCKQYIESNSNKFFFNSGSLFSWGKDFFNKETSKEIVNIANNICNNKFPYFNKSIAEFQTIGWNVNPFSGKKAPLDKHWIKISDLGADFGDIKFIWELSRFSFVYSLVRAYRITSNEKYVVKFWALFESWVENNPLEIGVNYKCGQEMSFRIMAWIFGLYSFLDHKESTNQRITTLVKFIYYHTNHVDKHFEFALKSVKNNHAISEAAGMYTVGTVLPFFNKSKKWREKGKKYLEKEGLRQIYEDGSYLQHSMNYQRLVIQNYTWVLQLAKLNGDSFSEELITRLKKCVKFLYNNQDKKNGYLPNYGMNDGALIHPLSSNDYLDYRPQLNAAWHVLTRRRLYQSGLHDENLLWICGEEALNSPVEDCYRKSQDYPVGGYYTIQGEGSFGLVRCGTYKDRPNQADMLHLDLWSNGENILTDAGTFSYNTDEEWLKYFNGTSSHNTIMINNKDQMEKASRFMWLNWTKSKLISFNQYEDGMMIFEGEHYGYKPLTHRRGVIHYEGQWVIIDDVFGDFSHEKQSFSLSWLFGVRDVAKVEANEWVLETNTEKWNLSIIESPSYKDKLYKGSIEPTKGWRSLYYGEKEPVSQLNINMKENKKIRIITVLSKDNDLVKYDSKSKSLKVHNKSIVLREIGLDSMFRGVENSL
ncbi:alginate lyase family protein [Priestia megaterium]|uniref:alginate lyase family protein n=1 Tax=Priestia megaterium TaxID=1404 RepID=UPI003EEF5953